LLPDYGVEFSPPPRPIFSAYKLRRLANILPSCSPGGIGHSLALEFHAHNFRVFAAGRDLSSFATLAARGIEILPLTVDSEPSIQSLLDTLTPLLHGRGLDYLVNNAGINYTVPALDINLPEVRDVFETNVFGVMRLCQVFAPLLTEAKGTIVMVGSLAGVIPYAFGSVYNASKAALHAYANTLRVEMAPLGVSVITVVTGGVKSRIGRKSRVLPEDSVYAALDEEYRARLTHSQVGAMANEEYANSVVRQVLPGAGPWPWRWFLKDARKRWIWEGNKSWVVWALAGGWVWSGFWDWYFTRAFRLWKLGKSKPKRT
jgi:1-acylglycerone phosphate reductase